MAVLLEIHYDKDEILETYLNEIYFGQDRDRAIHGVGLAAQYYFGKDVQYLGVAESAMLVGMIRGPAHLRPVQASRRARSSGATWCCARRATRARSRSSSTPRRAQRPLGVSRKSGMGTSPYPAFLKLVHRQLRRDYDEKDLRTEGLRIFTTLDPRAQGAAESALDASAWRSSTRTSASASPGSKARW